MSLAIRRFVSVAATTGLLAMAVLVSPVAATGTTRTYVIVYSSAATPAAKSTIAQAGGTLVTTYDAIGCRSRGPTG